MWRGGRHHQSFVLGQPVLSGDAQELDGDVQPDLRFRPAWKPEAERDIADGTRDDNVFDIEQGVAVSIFVKAPGLPRQTKHSDLFGKRQSKYEAVVNAALKNMEWRAIEPSEPDYLFVPRDAGAEGQYSELWSIRDIFGGAGDPAPGIVTTHDQFAISFSREEARSKVGRLLETKTEEEARRLFRLCTQDQWSYENAIAELPAVDLDTASQKVLYRPFDVRWTIWNENVAVHRRERVMKHMRRLNVALITSRQVKGEAFRHALATDTVSEVICLSPLTSNNGFVFPLWVYRGEERVEGFTVAFRDAIDTKYAHHFSPEEIFGYIYAVLHSPAYRSSYAEFLRRNFPRIPLADSIADFEVLSALGSALVEAHLLRKLKRRGLGDYKGAKQGEDENRVLEVRYAEAGQAVYINEAQHFAPIPPEVWSFHIGGYQVLEKYLKSRKNRVLTLDEIEHVAKVADVLAFTLEQMTAIDEAYRAAFPQQD